MEGHCESLLAQLLCSQIPPSASGSLRCDFYLRQSSKIKYLIQGSEKATWISLRCGQKVLPQCNQRKPFIVLEHIDLVALAAALRKGLFSRSYDNLPFTLSACRSLKTFGQFLCRRMRDFILHGVEGKLSGWEPDKEKLWSTFPAVLYSTILLRHWKGLFLVTPIWSRGSQGGALGPDRCWERPWGTGSQNISTGLPSAPGRSPTLRADLQERGAKGSALLCKGGGYLAQSREQLTSELSFSGFSCTREWARPLPVYKRLLLCPYSIQTESYDREYKVSWKLVFERWILETWIRTGLHFQLLGPNPSLSYSRKARVTTQCNQLFQIPLMWQEKSCLMTLRLTAFP